MWNMDETGFLMGWANSCKVIALRGRQIVKTIPGSREWCSSIDAISMGGESTPSFNIFKGKEYTREFFQTLKKAMPEAAVGMSENGWSNSDMGYEWLEHFEKHTRRQRTWAREAQEAQEEAIEGLENSAPEELDFVPPSPKKTGFRILIMDGHSSHVNLKFVSYCWSRKIIPICLPPHATHLLQPLDLVMFRKFKKAYSDKVDDYAARGLTGVDKEICVKILGEIRPFVFTRDNILSAFRAAGLSPLDPLVPKARCVTRMPANQRPIPQPTLLSSPFNPPTPKDELTRARFGATILDPSVPAVAKEATVRKLIDFAEAVAHQNQLLVNENSDLRQHADERQARKATKRVKLSTSESVLTVEQMEEIDNKRKEAEQERVNRQLRREDEKKARDTAKQQEEAALQARKEARATAQALRKEKDKFLKEKKDAQKKAGKLEKTAADLFRKQGQSPTALEARITANKATSEAQRLDELYQQADLAHKEASDIVEKLNQANRKSSKARRSQSQFHNDVDTDEVSDLENNTPGEEEGEFFGDDLDLVGVETLDFT